MSLLLGCLKSFQDPMKQLMTVVFHYTIVRFFEHTNFLSYGMTCAFAGMKRITTIFLLYMRQEHEFGYQILLHLIGKKYKVVILKNTVQYGSKRHSN